MLSQIRREMRISVRLERYGLEVAVSTTSLRIYCDMIISCMEITDTPPFIVIAIKRSSDQPTATSVC